MLNLLLTKMQLSTDTALIQLKATLYKNISLQTYKRSLMKNGRLGELIYVKNPGTIEEAMSQVLEYQNWQYQFGQSSAPQNYYRTTEQITPRGMKMNSAPPTAKDGTTTNEAVPQSTKLFPTTATIKN